MSESQHAKKKKDKWYLFGSGTDIIDTDILSSLHIEIFGNQKVNVEGCIGVSEYKDYYIKLKLKKGELIFCGEKFDIEFFENQLITIKGRLSSIEFGF